jgi:hypothetical protein
MFRSNHYRAIYRGEIFDFKYCASWLAARAYGARMLGASYATDVIIIDLHMAGLA